MKFSTAGSPFRIPFKSNLPLKIIVAVFFTFWAWTFIRTPNISNWLLENALVFLFIGGLILSYRKFVFSDLSYCLMFVYICMHIYGSIYTYALNPLGFKLQELFHTERNMYDRLVHFSFGFMLAYPMRDYFKNHFKWPVWVCWILPIEITLSFSCLYELIEWAVADVFFPEQGMDYLGTQGDIWDAQKDMFMAFCGAVAITILVSTLKRVLKK